MLSIEQLNKDTFKLYYSFNEPKTGTVCSRLRSGFRKTSPLNLSITYFPLELNKTTTTE